MARIVGVDLPRKKKVIYSLSYLHGVGLTTAKILCEKADVNFDLRMQDLNEKQVVSLRNAIADLGLKVEGELRSQVAMNIKRLKDAGSYKDFGIAGVFQSMVKEQKLMLEPEKVKSVQ